MRISSIFLAKSCFVLSPKKDAVFKSLSSEDIVRLYKLFPNKEMRASIQEELRSTYDRNRNRASR